MTIESTGDNALIESCVFEHIRYDRNDNLCEGIAIRLTKGRARNCLFRDITADDGRIYDYIVYLGGGAVLDNCTFTDCKVKHVAGRSDAAFVYSIYGNGDVRNCIVCIPKPVNPEDPLPLSVPIGNFNASKVRNCCCEGETTIGLNPADGTKINFGRGVPFDLSSTSSCRDAGMVCDWMTGSSKDLLGRPRLYGRAPDIGCCETRARPALVIQVY